MNGFLAVIPVLGNTRHVGDANWIIGRRVDEHALAAEDAGLTSGFALRSKCMRFLFGFHPQHALRGKASTLRVSPDSNLVQSSTYDSSRCRRDL